MLFDFLTLGLGALSRKIKNDKNYAEGKRILEERAKKPIWQQARENNSMIEINGKTFMFLTPHEIYINEKFWDSGLPLDDFLLKFYKENNKVFFNEFVRLIDKDGNEKMISSLYVSDLYYNSLNKKEKK